MGSRALHREDARETPLDRDENSIAQHSVLSPITCSSKTGRCQGRAGG